MEYGKKRAPGFVDLPNYRISFEIVHDAVDIIFSNEIIARSNYTLVLREQNYDPVYYLPAYCLKQHFIIPSPKETFCPFKGAARHWSILANDDIALNAVWAYIDPFEEVSFLAGYVAFYEEKVRISSSKAFK